MGAESPTGSVIGGFRVGAFLARGAMGAVYLAEDSNGQQVALKLLSPELAHDDRFRQRFLRESRVAATLDHPNVVRTLASGEDGGVLYLAMAYVDGVDLRELLRREGRFDSERAVAIVRQAGEALDAAHAAGLVHRDVKPGNILVADGPDGEHAYVCDFGLARHVSSVGSLTGDRGFVGTVDYVAPEQIRGEKVDGRVDVYALGCVLFECLAGERPFERESELAVVFAHLNEPPPRLTEVRPELPAAGTGRRPRAREGAGWALRHVRRARRRGAAMRCTAHGPVAAVRGGCSRGGRWPPWPRAGRSARCSPLRDDAPAWERAQSRSGRSCSGAFDAHPGESLASIRSGTSSATDTDRWTSSSRAGRHGCCCRSSSGCCAWTPARAS